MRRTVAVVIACVSRTRLPLWMVEPAMDVASYGVLRCLTLLQEPHHASRPADAPAEAGRRFSPRKVKGDVAEGSRRLTVLGLDWSLTLPRIPRARLQLGTRITRIILSLLFYHVHPRESSHFLPAPRITVTTAWAYFARKMMMPSTTADSFGTSRGNLLLLSGYYYYRVSNAHPKKATASPITRSRDALI